MGSVRKKGRERALKGPQLFESIEMMLRQNEKWC